MNTDSLMVLLNTVGVSVECGEPGLGWDIQQHAWELAVFVEEMQRLGVRRVLEIGTGASGGLARFMVNILGWDVTSIDPVRPTPEPAGRFVQGRSVDVWRQFADESFDLVFIDGDHSYEACRRDYDLYAPLARKAVAIHDIAMGRVALEGVGQTWHEVAYDDAQLRNGAHEIIAPDKALGIGWLERDTAARKTPRVAALVSVFNARDFLRGRLDNLLGQTIADDLDIVCVNAGSHHHEDAYVLAEYALAHPQVRVITTQRDPQMESWNVAIRATDATFVTNQNCDDRMAPWGLETLLDALERGDGADVAYSNAYCITDRESTWDGNWTLFKEKNSYPEGIIDWGNKPFSPRALYEGCFLGPFPMWRKALHDRAGWFDPSYAYAGDYEMWLRFAAHGARFVNVPVYTGTFYSDYAQLSRLDPFQLGTENRRIHMKYAGVWE